MEWRILPALLIATAVVAEETVTDDLLTGQWQTSGSVLDHTYPGGYLNGHVHTDYQGGSISQTIDLSSYIGQQEYNYFTKVTACENQIGGHCSSGRLDEFTVTLTLDTGETWTDTFWVGNSWTDIDLSYIPTADALSAIIDIYGQDEGYWAGWYGPVYYAGEFTVTYDPTLVAVILPAAEDPTLQTTALDSVFTPTVDVVEVPVIETPTVEVAAETPTENPEPVQEATSAESTPADTGSGSDSSGNDSGGGSGESAPRPSGPTKLATLVTTLDVANASMDSLPGDPADPVTQVLAIAVMASQGVEIEDVKLDQPELPKGPEIRDNRRMADRYWLNRLASDAKFEKYMVDAQWQDAEKPTR